MRILHVDHSPLLGGAERSVLELARAQATIGHSVSVAVGQRGSFSDALTSAGIDWHDLRWSDRYVNATRVGRSGELLTGLPDVCRAAATLRRLIVRRRPNVVQAHTRKAQLVATLAAAGLDTALVWHLRDDLPARPPLRASITLALRRADHAVALSEWLIRSYVSRGAVPASGRIGRVPSGIDATALAALPTPWLDGRRQPVVGYVGQIARWKAPHLLVDAADHLADVAASFRIIGGVWFPAAEEAYGEWLERRVARLAADGRVAWLGATARPEDAFAEIDVLVHTSVEAEPFGRVLVEAMAARRPIVALNRGAARELLDESTAVFVDRPDGPSLAAAVRDLLGRPDHARQQAERAAGRAAAYAPAAVAALMDAEYERMPR